MRLAITHMHSSALITSLETSTSLPVAIRAQAMEFYRVTRGHPTVYHSLLFNKQLHSKGKKEGPQVAVHGSDDVCVATGILTTHQPRLSEILDILITRLLQPRQKLLLT